MKHYLGIDIGGTKIAVGLFDQDKSKIVAFYEGNVERKEIVRALKQYLPAFMVPNVFRQVEQMPLTKNGKIDRKALMTEYQEDNR